MAKLSIKPTKSQKLHLKSHVNNSRLFCLFFAEKNERLLFYLCEYQLQKQSHLLTHFFMQSAKLEQTIMLAQQQRNQASVQIGNKVRGLQNFIENSNISKFDVTLTDESQQLGIGKEETKGYKKYTQSYEQFEEQERKQVQGKMQEEFEESESLQEQQQSQQASFSEFQQDDSEEYQIQNYLYAEESSPKYEHNNFDSLFYVAIEPFIKKLTNHQIVNQYKSSKQSLEAQQMHLKQQTQSEVLSLPLGRMLKKHSINQSILKLVNQNYLAHLELEGGKRQMNYQISGYSDNSSSMQEEPSLSDYVSQDEILCKLVNAKKVVFRDEVKVKIFRQCDEVTAMQQSLQFGQMLNTTKKPLTRRISPTSLPENSSPNKPAADNISNAFISQEKSHALEKELQEKLLKQLECQNFEKEERNDKIKSKDVSCCQQMKSIQLLHQLISKKMYCREETDILEEGNFQLIQNQVNGAKANELNSYWSKSCRNEALQLQILQNDQTVQS